jgi:hypothetical protein
MQTSRDRSFCFLIGTAAVLMSLLGCSRTAPEATATTFTLATGVKLVDQTACATTAEDPALSIAKKDTNTYLVRARGSFECDGEFDPFLTVSIDKKATLVLRQQAASSGCECGRTIDITIENRLKSGDTIYVLHDYRVIGHLTTP